jgi:tetratricopeptide (TPR) repeat protein
MHPKAPRVEAQRQAPAQRCPNCNAPIQEGDIICLRCGTNLLTGHKIAEEQKLAVAEERRSMTPLLVALVLLAVAVVVGILLYFLLRPSAVAEGRELLQQERYLEAIDLLAAHVEEAPTDAEAQLLLGRARLAANQHVAAADAFEAAFRQPASDVDTGLLAVAALSKSPGKPVGRQIALLREITQKAPGNGRAWYLLGLAQQVSGDTAGAIESFRRASELGEGAAATGTQLGIAYALQDDYAQAEAELTQAQNAEPASGDIQAALGALRDIQGDMPAAQVHWDAALQNGTSIPQLAQARLALIYLEQGNIGAATPLLQQAREGTNAVPAADFFEALGMQLDGRQAEAIIALEQVASGSGAMKDEASAMLAALYLDTGDLPRARDALGKAAGAPQAMVRTIEGRIALAEGDEAGAQSAFQAAVAADSSYASGHLELGLLYIRRGALTEGLRELERYLDLARVAGESSNLNQIEVLVEQLRQTSEAPVGDTGAGR